MKARGRWPLRAGTLAVRVPVGNPIYSLWLSSKRFHSTPPARAASELIRRDNIVWVDVEMTGLDPNVDHILEMACVITDGELNTLATVCNRYLHTLPISNFSKRDKRPLLTIQPHNKAQTAVISQPKEVLAGMNSWCIARKFPLECLAGLKKI